MLGRSYEGQNCSAARTLELVGERWSLLILRDALLRGYTRFSQFQRSLRVAPNILATRLERFVAAGLLQVEGGNYVVTDKGRDLQPVLLALTAWGDRWAAPDGPPVVYQHDHCGGRISQHVECGQCGTVAATTGIVAKPGPGARAARLG